VVDNLLETYSEYTGPSLTLAQLKTFQDELGFQLPQAYIELLLNTNGGIPINPCVSMSEPTSWADDHIEIDAILGFGAPSNLMESAYMIEEWGYPNIGVVFCSTPASGHNAVMLDYLTNPLASEPRVVYINDEDDMGNRKIVLVANTFAEFLAKMVPANTFPL
jgi:hypothetical protein